MYLTVCFADWLRKGKGNWYEKKDVGPKKESGIYAGHYHSGYDVYDFFRGTGFIQLLF